MCLGYLKDFVAFQGLVLIVVDVSDMPNSFYPSLPELIGADRDVYVIGNKVDCIPKDGTGTLLRHFSSRHRK